MPFFRDFLLQTNELLAQQSVTRKLIAFCVLLAVLIFGVVQLFQYGKHIEYEVLYAGLDAESAKTLTDAMAASAPGIPKQILQDERGWTIKVPSDRVLDLRLELAPNIQGGGGRVGWELFDRTSIGVTDFTQKINRQRATQGELERTIQGIDVVKMAKVKLAIPDESLFMREEEEPKASVFVELYPKSLLSSSKVQAIQALVAGSIEGLQPGSVTVVDAGGRLLSKAPDDEGAETADLDARILLAEQQEKQRKDYERYLEDKIETSLSKVFGPEHISARVNVDFDFTAKEVNELKYNPKSVPLAESISRTAQVYGSSSGVSGGIAGSSAHLPPDAGFTSSAISGAVVSPLTTEQTITNYNVGKTETKTVYPPFEIRRITAAVLVDHIPVEKRDTDGKLLEVTQEKLQPEDLKNIEDQVRQIINYSEDRPGGVSDMVTVSQMAFRSPQSTSPEGPLSTFQRQRFILMGIKYGLLALAVLLLVLFVVRPLMHIIAPRPLGLGVPMREAAASIAGPELRQALPDGTPASGSLGGETARGALPGPASLKRNLTAQEHSLDKEILELARSNPKKVSLVLRSWIES